MIPDNTLTAPVSPGLPDSPLPDSSSEGCASRPSMMLFREPIIISEPRGLRSFESTEFEPGFPHGRVQNETACVTPARA